MAKYNKSEIMKAAWKEYRFNRYMREEDRKSFSECLKKAWAQAKEDVKVSEMLRRCVIKRINGGYVEMRHGMTASGFEGWMVTGKTYYAKTVLRWMGFEWDPEGRCWETANRNVAKLFALYNY